MNRCYVTTTLLLVLAFGTFTSVLAETSGTNLEVPVKVRENLDPPIKVREVQMNTKVRVSATTTDIKKTNLELQRDKIRVEAETRKKAAEDRGDATTTRREAIKLEIEAKWQEQDTKREAMKAEFEMKRASSTERRVEWQQNVAKRKVEHTIRVMTATIERLEKIIVRIETRIAKVKAAGGATVESEGYIVDAKADLALAKTAISAFATIDLSSDTAQENFERIRTAAAQAREHIRNAHHDMMLAVRSLRALEVDVTATSTTSVQ